MSFKDAKKKAKMNTIMARKKIIDRFNRRFGNKPSISSMLPNITTLMGICSGMSSIHFALLEKWDFCIIAIILAALFDAMDGSIARLLKSSSQMGMELDSLADLISFGAAPAVVMYLYSLNIFGKYGWSISLFYTCCMALRLARFNTLALSEEEKPAWQEGFFVGIPAPAAAFLCMLPLSMDMQFGGSNLENNYPIPTGIWMIIIGFFMVSKIPTFSMKKIRVSKRLILPIMILFTLLITLAVSAPWLAYIAIALIFISSIPISYIVFKRRSSKHIN